MQTKNTNKNKYKQQKKNKKKNTKQNSNELVNVKNQDLIMLPLTPFTIKHRYRIQCTVHDLLLADSSQEKHNRRTTRNLQKFPRGPLENISPATFKERQPQQNGAVSKK
jgi:hypothetical protein